MTAPVVVVGGGLAGLAAAARLAKAGHAVELYEQTDQLGGTWAPGVSDGHQVDDAPAVLGFPAPWRDLFRKSGRPLEAELARMGYALVPAGPPTYVFADGARLVLPTGRGDQLDAVSAAYGSAVAAGWRVLLDLLDDVWQTLRPLGLEAELTGRSQLDRGVRRRLLGRRSLADLATTAGHPHLTAIVRSLAYRLGSTPEESPALAGVELSMAKTFGRWQVEPLAGTPGDPGRSSVLVEALVARLALRRVTVRLGTEVTEIQTPDGHVRAVTAAQGSRPATAVVATGDPWRTYDQLLPRSVARRTRRRLRALRPATGPAVRHTVDARPVDGVTETVSLSGDGVPVISYRRPVASGSVTSTHDFTSPVRAARYGTAWHGLGSWLRRPPVTGEVPGLFLAGPWSAAGPAPSPVVLSGALAAYAAHDYLGDEG